MAGLADCPFTREAEAEVSVERSVDDPNRASAAPNSDALDAGKPDMLSGKQRET
jgi:hypothetical protein